MNAPVLVPPPGESPVRRLLRAILSSVAAVARFVAGAAASVVRAVGGIFRIRHRAYEPLPPPLPRTGSAAAHPDGPARQAPESVPAEPQTREEPAPEDEPLTKEEPAPEREPPSPPGAPVLLGGSAPRRARPRDVILAQFVAYVQPFEEKARRALAREADEDEIRLGVQTDCRWAVGARVTVRCTARGLTVLNPVQGFLWDGECGTASFEIEVPADAEPRSTVIVIQAFVGESTEPAPDPVGVGTLRMALDVGDEADDEPPQEVQGESDRTAFASYASEDRIEVLGRVSSIRRSAGLDVFVDVVGLRMGDRWEERLREQIAACDRFLLFWSENAAGKQWVEWEWQQALDDPGEDALELHLLQSTPIEKVPERLRKYHCDDVYLRARDAEMYRRQSAGPAPGG